MITHILISQFPRILQLFSFLFIKNRGYKKRINSFELLWKKKCRRRSYYQLSTIAAAAEEFSLNARELLFVWIGIFKLKEEPRTSFSNKHSSFFFSQWVVFFSSEFFFFPTIEPLHCCFRSIVFQVFASFIALSLFLWAFCINKPI